MEIFNRLNTPCRRIFFILFVIGIVIHILVTIICLREDIIHYRENIINLGEENHFLLTNYLLLADIDILVFFAKYGRTTEEFISRFVFWISVFMMICGLLGSFFYNVTNATICRLTKFGLVLYNATVCRVGRWIKNG